MLKENVALFSKKICRCASRSAQKEKARHAHPSSQKVNQSLHAPDHPKKENCRNESFAKKRKSPKKESLPVVGLFARFKFE
jgi:hypothetical protein